MSLTTYVVAGLLVVSVFFGLVTAIGLVRLPDLYTRAHAASKTETLSAVLALGAVVLAFGVDGSTVKVGLLLLFMFLTNPTAAHAITRAAYDQDIEPWTVDAAGSGGADTAGSGGLDADHDGPRGKEGDER